MRMTNTIKTVLTPGLLVVVRLRVFFSRQWENLGYTFYCITPI
jgi:hypothetical protein